MAKAHGMMAGVIADETTRQDHALALRMHLYKVYGTSVPGFFGSRVVPGRLKAHGRSPATHAEARRS